MDVPSQKEFSIGQTLPMGKDVWQIPLRQINELLQSVYEARQLPPIGKTVWHKSLKQIADPEQKVSRRPHRSPG